MTRIAGLTKERVKSVIVCKDREFKAKAVHLLNGAAFPSEKYTVATLEHALDYINSDRTILNLVIDGSMFSPDALENTLQELERSNCNEQVNLLCMLDDAQIKEEERFEKIFCRTFLEHFPMLQSHYNRAFHSKKTTRQSNILHPPLEHQEEEIRQNKPPSLSIIETSKHLKDTVDMINQLHKSRTYLESIRDIGQRFNGLIGAFHFFGSKKGFPKLRELAEMIDSVCRSYQPGSSAQEVSSEHLTFITEAAKCSYLILKDLRDGSTITDEHMQQHQKLADAFSKLKDVKIRNNEDQQSVDDIIDAQINKSS